MKKAISLLLALVMCLSLCACEPESATSDNTSSSEATTEHAANNSIQTNENETITVSAAAFSGMDNADIAELIDEYNFESFSENEDGSVTITMSKATKDAAITHYRDQIDSILSLIMEGSQVEGELFECVLSVTCNDTFTEVNYTLEESTFSRMIILYEAAFRVNIAWYQALCGTLPDDISLIVNYTYDGEETPFIQNTIDFSKRSPKADDSDSQEDETEPTVSAQVLCDSDEITIDDYCKFTVVGWDNIDAITRNGMKMLTGSTNENNTIIRLTLDYTNTSNSEQETRIDAEHAREDDLLQSATLTFDGKYIYTGGCGCWSDLIPLAQDELYIFFNVPKTVLESEGSIILEFQISNQLFTYTIR